MGTKVTRRGFISGSSALALTAAAAAKGMDANAYPGFASEFAPHSKSFMDQYYDGIMDIVKGIRDTETGVISRAMQKAYELRKKGGSIVSNVVYGHFSYQAGSAERPGQPGLLPQYTSTANKMIENMKEGDFLLTDMVSESRKKARERGAYVVGVTNNYYRFFKTPPGGLRESNMQMTVEEMSNMVIDSYVPWDNGLVSAPEVPQFKLCPSTGIAQYAVYWACTASLANLVGTRGKGSSAEPAHRYLDMLLERYIQIGTDRPKIDRISSKWTDLVLGEKARLFVYGQPFKNDRGGSGNMFVSDAVGAASGSMIAQGYSDEVRENDIVLIGSICSNNPQEIEVARTARKKGAYTVAFCPYTTEGDASGVRLYKEVDDALNTYSDESAGVIAVKRFDEKVCPLTGLTGNLILWLLTAQWTDHMARRGEMPYYWQGFHESGGRDYDNSVRPYFLKRGY